MAPTIITSTLVPAVQGQTGKPLDLVTRDDVKLELKVDGGADDAWIDKIVTRSSSAIARHCNRVFQVQTYQDQFWALRDPFPWQLPSGFMPLQLTRWPLASAPSPAGTAPPKPAALSFAAGGSNPQATYYVRSTYVTPQGETAGSLESRIVVPANNLLVVSAPGVDANSTATSWNAYVGIKPSQGILQASGLTLGSAWTMPASGLVTAGTALPSYISVAENYPLAPVPLIEGTDFEGDYDAGLQTTSKGWLTRLFPMDAAPRRWEGLPILVTYQAGYADIPDELQDACLRLVKSAWFARTRDPRLREENVEGVLQQAWWFASGPGGGALPPDVEAMIDDYRVPVIA